jgi:hypothetical protein
MWMDVRSNADGAVKVGSLFCATNAIRHFVNFALSATLVPRCMLAFSRRKSGNVSLVIQSLSKNWFLNMRNWKRMQIQS